jgi:hypothetical protein
MPTQNRETPRERYKSDPLTEEERHDLPIRRAEAIASGPVIENSSAHPSWRVEIFTHLSVLRDTSHVLEFGRRRQVSSFPW